MDVYKKYDIGELVNGNPYVGRGIVIGKTEDGKKAAVAYFIMGKREVGQLGIVDLIVSILIAELVAISIENYQDPSPARLTPIEFFLSTHGGACYDGLALHDVIESSNTPIEVICAGKIMSMGVIVALGAKVRKAYRNTTFMIHQVSGLSFGTLREMEDTVAEASRINGMLFRIIREKTCITEDQLNEVLQRQKDWFMTAEEALELGILTELL